MPASAGNFRKIGEGGFGSVHQVIDSGRIRIKKIDKKSNSIVIDNIEIMAELGSHENIVRVDLKDKLMEDEGAPVSELIKTNHNGKTHEKGLPVKLIRSVGKQILTGLDHIHKHGVIHFDIKPDNLIVNNTGSVRIADFGRAKMTDKQGCVHFWNGDHMYMPPEIYVGRRIIKSNADNWSAGCCLYELVAGEKFVSRPMGIFCEIHGVNRFSDIDIDRKSLINSAQNYVDKKNQRS